MENKKLRSFENYNFVKLDKKINEDIALPSNQDDVINNKIKDIISNILKSKTYFMLLQDTAEQVYDMINEVIPDNRQAFIDTLFSKNQLLGDLIEDIIDIVDSSTALEDIGMMVDNLKNLDKYTEDNMDELLNGKKSLVGYSEEDDDDDYEEEDEDDGFDDDFEGKLTKYMDEKGNFKDKMTDEEIEIDKKYHEEDQLKRKKPVTEGKKGQEIEDFIKKYSKPESNDKFKKGDIVYLNGIITAVGKRFNGKKCEIIRKSEENEDCYDLYDPSIKGKDGDSNVKGMPSKYIFKEKPSVITEPEEKMRVKPKATKKAPKK